MHPKQGANAPKDGLFRIEVEDVIQQRRLARTQEPGQESDLEFSYHYRSSVISSAARRNQAIVR